jgi:hypothetical protein
MENSSMESEALKTLENLQLQLKAIEKTIAELSEKLKKNIKQDSGFPQTTIDARHGHIMHHSAKGTAKMEKVAKEFHEGKLYSHGHKVTNPKQMAAIAESERRAMGYK